MVFGKKDDAADESGHYVVDQVPAPSPGKLTNRLNERWGQGWRLVRIDEFVDGFALVTYERMAP